MLLYSLIIFRHLYTVSSFVIFKWFVMLIYNSKLQLYLGNVLSIFHPTFINHKNFMFTELNNCLQTRQTILLCENSIVEEGVQNYHHVKLAKNSPRPQSENLHRKEQTRMERDTTSLVADTYRWSGTDFVQTPTEEPFVSHLFWSSRKSSP